MAEAGGPRTPASRAWRRLWEAARPERDEHPIDLPTLGEYAALLELHGRGAAARAFPAVARHLATGCQACEPDLREMLTILAADRGQA